MATTIPQSSIKIYKRSESRPGHYLVSDLIPVDDHYLWSDARLEGEPGAWKVAPEGKYPTVADALTDAVSQGWGIRVV